MQSSPGQWDILFRGKKTFVSDEKQSVQVELVTGQTSLETLNPHMLCIMIKMNESLRVTVQSDIVRHLKSREQKHTVRVNLHV